MSNTPKDLYEFDKFRLDVSERILWRAGERVPLSEKAFDTLVVLVKRGNHLVSKDDLLTEVWADTIVEENNLDKNISILRKVLGERADKGKFIETVRGHGFRFVPSVQILVSEIQRPNPVESEIEPLALKNESENLNSQNEPEIRGLKLQEDFQAQKPEPGTDQIPNSKSRITNRKWFAVVAVLSVLAFGAAAGFYWRRENSKTARELDPLNLRINALEGMFLLHAGQTDEAIARLRKTLELDSNFRLAIMFSARAYSEKGRFAEAVAATEKAKELSVVSTEAIAFGAYALAKSGKLAEARAALDELLELSKSQYVPPYNIALVYNALGDSDKALDYLEKGFAEKDVRIVFLKVEPKWNNLRGEPRFADLMRRMNFE